MGNTLEIRFSENRVIPDLYFSFKIEMHTNSVITITFAGNRNWNTGYYNNQGANGNYWSSSPSSSNAFNLNFNSSTLNPSNTNNRANGFSVRCLKQLYFPHSCKNSRMGNFTPHLPTFLMQPIDLFRAYYECRRNKRSTTNALAFELNYESNLLELYDDIVTGKYEIGKSIAFIVNYPVKREIFAGDFRDRIVHHFVMQKLNPIFEKKFIYDSYSCRVGKGTHFGIRRIETFMRSATDNFRKDAYVLKLDISGFFMNIDKQILFEFIKSSVEKKYTSDDKSILLSLCYKIVFNEPTKNCSIK